MRCAISSKQADPTADCNGVAQLTKITASLRPFLSKNQYHYPTYIYCREFTAFEITITCCIQIVSSNSYFLLCSCNKDLDYVWPVIQSSKT